MVWGLCLFFQTDVAHLGVRLNRIPTSATSVGKKGQSLRAEDRPPQQAEMAGYLLVPHGKVPEQYNAGFSMYVAAWPLLKHYPGQEFQSGFVRPAQESSNPGHGHHEFGNTETCFLIGDAQRSRW